MVTHSSILAWEIPWMAELDCLQSMGSQRIRHNLSTKTTNFGWKLENHISSLCQISLPIKLGEQFSPSLTHEFVEIPKVCTLRYLQKYYVPCTI